LNNPIAIRYPRGRGKIPNFKVLNSKFQKIEIGKAHLLKSGTKTAILSTGFIGNNASLALNEISNSSEIAHYDFGFIKPLDENLLHQIFKSFETIITLEDGTKKGGFGSSIIEFASENNYKSNIKTLGIPDKFIEHGTVDELQKICKIDVESLKLLFSKI
jgi:1-deoxy-D-xylulose-5-phosphate synthase